ncbi:MULTISPECIES: EmrA/EmrK family multidrug efflux transporter periplasmic adaptor subunit [Sphingobium]|uniref:EmrA/EmrK family multidrug efflux transporter periplasmic adaptor subunit n=1 Tax=Sphingobium fuliginis ATCC 27551 TaxID=1208342 RepID=A0A5B8CGD4_SPHSA|nr:MULTISPECIES: EmrA/EmrK family multidrug efflux transporter periplasmic adaptor subunit [Sphingobium]OAP29790.1 efflux transporter periplasmic adaptor subunit [Sphingobium sp. 20006FA]KXU30088.1 efflux transporter periplasmic adaptor subunit [Sphingobium sp. AM]KYC30203.1 efflux transporter periplasmic adaptor subunit [Sphingobium sp. 22B]PNP93731.1 efflux transporter periplasmic adaptor subunit [Sphingobium sp. SA916]QDC37975.1 EmrA/EmrK family multidrug efflux transporter periplasmic adap
MADAKPEFTSEASKADDAADAAARRMETRRKWLVRLALVILVVGAAYALWYLLVGRNHVSTDNAYVNAEVAQVTPLISAQAVEVLVTDTQAVKRGDILVKLDPTNARIAVAQAEADLAEARRRFRQTLATSGSLAAQVEARGADINQARAQLATAQADFDKARIDLRRREALAPNGAVSGEELTSARKAYAAAQAALDLAKAGVATAEATRGAASGQLAANDALVRGSTVDTDPAVLAAKAKLDNARLDLDRSIIRAPIDGVVTRRSVQVGQRVAQGSPIMSIVPLAQVYVDANFKERQLGRVKVGMPATVTSDLYGGDVVYHGKVIGFAGGTGASMALIPAQNATGNWIKVVQRLPVRIALDPRELAEHPLRIGLSMEAEIDLSGE